MGPIRSFSGMIEDVNSQTIEIANLVHRIREASRRLTGSDGQTPVPISAATQGRAESPERPPLLVSLTTGLEELNSTVADLRNEVTYLENFSETAVDGGKSVTVAAFGQR